MKRWLATLPLGDEKKTNLNKIKYNLPGDSEKIGVLHAALMCNQLKIAKLLLEEGAGMYTAQTV